MIKRTISFLFLIFCLVACGGNKKEGKTTDDKQSGDTIQSIDLTENAKPILNVYLENSGSMDGYVQGVTEFEQAVYSYLSDVKISDVTDELNLFYINSNVIAQGSDIADFIEKLEPASFKAKGGNRKSSDISDVLKTILNETTDSIVSILVSDCIFSPGKGRDAEQYLVNQQIGIKSSFAEHIKRSSMAVIIYQLFSQFDGLYYNREDNPIKINEVL